MFKSLFISCHSIVIMQLSNLTMVCAWSRTAFEKEMGGVHSTRPSIDIPPELQCPLCHEVMKNAAMTSRCCFTSFCDGCKWHQ